MKTKGISLTIPVRDLELSPFDLYSKYRDDMHKAFLWQEETQKAYWDYITKLKPYLKDIPFNECTWADYQDAIQKMNQKRNKPYAINTLKTIGSVIRDLCRFAEHYSNGAYQNTTWGAAMEQLQPDAIALDERIDAIKASIPKSLTTLEEVKLIHIIESDISESGFAAGLAIMFYLGLRPGECCGLTYGDIRPLDGYDGVRCLYVTRQIRSTNEMTNHLKTENAYRILPNIVFQPVPQPGVKSHVFTQFHFDKIHKCLLCTFTLTYANGA